MKKIAIISLLFLVILSVNAQNLTVGTFNLRLQTTADVGNLWINRSNAVSDLIRFHDFDILGTQEGFYNQLNDIKNALPYYSFYGEGRDGGNAGEHSAIFYKTEKMSKPQFYKLGGFKEDYKTCSITLLKKWINDTYFNK